MLLKHEFEGSEFTNINRMNRLIHAHANATQCPEHEHESQYKVEWYPNPKSIDIKSFQPVVMMTFTALRSYICRRDCMY
jgi:hypothetical protein